MDDESGAAEGNEDDGTEGEEDPPVAPVSKSRKKKKKNRKLNSDKRMLDGDKPEDTDGQDRENSLSTFLSARCMNACLN